ncbi:heat shock protein DnaJ domain protein [[Leptolyngbya] sp. PCC 7376]|uniref:IMS domain-containing protein n=1 Tax=[Leptolyngbya] sp. PCC 7376 TaxID=111781 RepID=UPI00029F1448|nr:IMS domain-containing protein [[Leptolyngbya] sp. PCC 7376]AFY39542.1 heat shock protein DnaJ domain protein [[Leptolyngbya] sp. PCC 7376]
MRIPLDYYRILGVPTKATTAQITQAYRDRVAQLPRREHSDLAIQARNNIIEQSYQVLSQTEKRAVYDNEFLNDTYQLESQSRLRLPFQSSEIEAAEDAETSNPAIAIEQTDFLGGILLLLELGEYELVLKLVPPYLKSKSNLVKQDLFGSAEVVTSELILCLALAYLELSREQWQQGRYEAAAESGLAGQKLLIDAGIFPSLRGEIQGDLDRLRPYQALELLSQPESETALRTKGLQLLQAMLDARGGIDGAGDDQSGLSMDDFLRFIQQLRSYLTVKEQQDLFIAESKRPSAVSTYLAVYALLAGGFSSRQPESIIKAKEKLLRLGKRQDVHLEQAICALLLGQTEEANQALELSQEYEAIAYIRDNSKDAPDLLPGLCLYGEKWLKTEVFSHFRDLSSESVSLTEYFADDQVQQYLEQLPAESGAQDWSIVASESAKPTGQTRLEPVADLSVSRPSKVSKPEETAPTTSATATSKVTPISRPSSAPITPRTQTATPAQTAKIKKPKKRKSNRNLKRKPFPFKGIAILVGGLVALILVVKAIASLVGGGNTIKDPLQVSVTGEPPIPIPIIEEVATEAPLSKVPEGEFDAAIAERLIQTWLDGKALAFGESHDTSSLPEILAEPLLSRWVNGARDVEAVGNYREYEHELSISEVSFDPESPDVANVVAEVTENAKYYLPGGELDSGRSYDSQLTVRYGLIRQGEQWFIQSSAVL